MIFNRPFILFLLGIIVLPQLSFGDALPQTVDALLQSIQSSSDNEKSAAYRKAAEVYLDDSPQLAIQYADTALHLAKTQKNKMEIAESCLLIAKGYSALDQYDSSFHYLQLAEPLFEQNGNAVKRSDVLNMQGLNYQKLGNHDEAQRSFRNALRTVGNASAEKKATIYQNIGNGFIYESNSDSALYYTELALQLRRSVHNPDTAECHINKGIILMDQGNYPASLKSYLVGLSVYEAQKDSLHMSAVHSNLGVLYAQMHEYEKALDSYRFALNQQVKRGNRLAASKMHTNIGRALSEQGKNDEAIVHFRKALELLEEIGSEQDLWVAIFNVGYYHHQNGEYKLALDYLKRSLSKSEETSNLQGIAVSCIQLALVYEEKGEYSNAIKFAERGVKNARELGELPIIEYALFHLSSVYQSAGDDGESLSVFKEYIEVKDSILNQTNLDKIAELQAKYELERKQRDIERLETEATELKLENQVTSLQRTTLLVLLLLLVVVGGFLVFFQRSRINQHQLENELLQQDALSFARQIARKNEALENLRRKLEPSEETSLDSKAQFISLFKLIESNMESDDEWDVFVQKFGAINPDFFPKLESRFPELTNTDLRLASLIKLRLSTKEIASIINIEYHSVKKGRQRLKKKLNLDAKQDLAKFLYEF